MNTDSFMYPFRRLIISKINGGTILLFVAIIAMIIANSPLSEYYNAFFGKELSLTFGDFNLFKRHDGNAMTLLDFINDALMAIFFFSVGLEIKREIMVGELSSPKKALLPIIAAIGGMLVPVLIFTLIGEGGPAGRGKAIPMATDIAFSIGVLSLLGKRVPISLKVFLTALAVVDDIGGIIVIALFYSDKLIISYLLYSIFVIGILSLGGKYGIHNKLFYIFFGIVVWYLFIQSGIHPTIAGVVVAFTVPARPKIDIYKYVKEIREDLRRLPENSNGIMLSNSEMYVLKRIESSSDKVISPLQGLSDDLHSIVNFIVMPLFAFANAGITFGNISLHSLSGVTLTVFISLVFGKLIGIFTFTYIPIKLGFLKMPLHMNRRNLFGVSLLGGIGFTVSLFIANLSYAGLPDVGAELLNQAKIGVVAGSIFAGLCGYLYLDKTLPKKAKH